MKHIPTALFLSTLAGLSLGIAGTAQAQTAARFSTVEFKDTTLNDALEMIFQAANNPAHTIDPSASLVPIGSITLQNIQWDAALRSLANQNNFKVSRGADGSYLVEPREPVLQDGLEGGFSGGGGFPGSGGFPGRGGSSSSGAAPFNPFGGGRTSGSGRTRGGAPTARESFSFEMVPPVTTQSNAQTTPRRGGTTTGNNDTEGQELQPPIYVRHIYVGGIAQLFGGSVIPTQPFVSPASAGGGMMGGMGMGGMGMGGMGMGGMGMGGMGMGGMGMGGMGMGGMGGGMMGGMGGMGGFGGMGGGMMGGGFGGMGGGMMGGGGFGGNQFGGGGFGFGF